MMKTVMAVSTVLVLTCLSGCTDGNSLLVTQADFDKVTNSIFKASDFTRRGGGSAGGGDEMEFTAVYEPNDPAADLHFDFGAWDSFLKAVPHQNEWVDFDLV